MKQIAADLEETDQIQFSVSQVDSDDMLYNYQLQRNGGGRRQERTSVIHEEIKNERDKLKNINDYHALPRNVKIRHCSCQEKNSTRSKVPQRHRN